MTLKETAQAIEKCIRRIVFGDHTEKEKRARQAMHKLSNEVQALNAVTERMKKSDDPWHEFVMAIRGESMNGRERHH